MAVYVDDAIWKWAGRCWCHLMADDTDELHRFAVRLGLHSSSYQGPPKTSAPHYDITGFERDRAMRLGATACSRDEIVAVFRRVKVADGKVARPHRRDVPARLVEKVQTFRDGPRADSAPPATTLRDTGS